MPHVSDTWYLDKSLFGSSFFTFFIITLVCYVIRYDIFVFSSSVYSTAQLFNLDPKSFLRRIIFTNIFLVTDYSLIPIES